MNDIKKDDNKNHVQWYVENQNLYKDLAKKIELIISELLQHDNINCHIIVSRGKEISSFSEKIKRKKYDNPQDDITDLAGIRIVTYVEGQIPPICQIIESNFNIDTANSSDKSVDLGEDKVGYKSVHYIAKLKENRLLLPEYKRFEEIKFEIQIRTILQHAWAEIEHDKNYKFSGILPPEVKRRFKLLAGALETADREFNSIANEIDLISKNTRESTKKGELDIEINSTTLREYIKTKFSPIVKDSYLSSSRESLLLSNLSKLKINTLEDLDKIIPANFLESKRNIGGGLDSIDTLLYNLLRSLVFQPF